MITVTFHIGESFDTVEGIATITGYNGNLADIEVEIPDFDDEGNDLETTHIENERWTRQEIEQKLHEATGRNHKVFIEKD